MRLACYLKETRLCVYQQNKFPRASRDANFFILSLRFQTAGGPYPTEFLLRLRQAARHASQGSLLQKLHGARQRTHAALLDHLR
jgi:hypothetical protein